MPDNAANGSQLTMALSTSYSLRIPGTTKPRLAGFMMSIIVVFHALVPRLRPLDSWAAALIAHGTRESPTFRSLVDRLDRSDVIVYVEVGRKTARAHGALRFVGATKSARMVHVSLSHRLTNTELVALLGHELHHAVEIAENPGIRDEDSLRQFYRTHGFPGCDLGTYESEGARQAGRRVRREIAEGHPGPDG